MNSEKVFTSALVVIGNEVLSGRTRDANLSWLAKRLNRCGVRMMEARIIPDMEETIISTVNELRARFDYVFTTGGIGPTHDDITALSIARAFGIALERSPQAESMLREHYKPEDRTDARMKMADIPAGATLLDNPVSRAPGFQVENVFVLPGVPGIMRAMVDGFAGRLAGGRPMLSKTISSFIPEGRVAASLTAVQEAHPELEIGSYPFMRDGKPGASLVIRGRDPNLIKAASKAIRSIIRELGNEPIQDTETLT